MRNICGQVASPRMQRSKGTAGGPAISTSPWIITPGAGFDNIKFNGAACRHYRDVAGDLIFGNQSAAEARHIY